MPRGVDTTGTAHEPTDSDGPVKTGAVTGFDAPVEGVWEGVLKVGAVELRVVLHVSRGAGGAPQATLDVPDQGAHGLAIDALVFNDSELRFDMKTPAAPFAGTRDATGRVVVGTYEQAGTPVA